MWYVWRHIALRSTVDVAQESRDYNKNEIK